MTLEYVECDECYKPFAGLRDLNKVLRKRAKTYSLYDGNDTPMSTETLLLCDSCLAELKEKLNERNTDS
jgi:hypothetical protein